MSGWVKPIVKSFMSFDYNVRNKVSITLASPEEEERGGNEIFSFGDHQQVTTSCLNVNNNYSSKRTVKDRNKSLAVKCPLLVIGS